jgi:hypothetical protein
MTLHLTYDSDRIQAALVLDDWVFCLGYLGFRPTHADQTLRSVSSTIVMGMFEYGDYYQESLEMAIDFEVTKSFALF